MPVWGLLGLVPVMHDCHTDPFPEDAKVESAMRADLVLEGGGVKGIGLVGALSVLEERGYRIERVAGTSAGAIVGALVAAQYSAAELKSLMETLDYTRFRDTGLLDRVPVVGKALSLLVEKGMYEGNYLKSWLHERLVDKGVRTFGDLKRNDPGSSLPAAHQYALVVIASDISRGRLCRLPWDYHLYDTPGGADGTAVVDAVRASMSIPFFYEPVNLPARGGEKSWLVDGGMLSNFPVNTFDRRSGERPRWPTFGIKLSARPLEPQGVAHRVQGALSMVQAMVATMTGFHDQIHLDDPATLDRTIFVDTTGVRGTDFDIDRATQQWLFDNGRRAAEQFFAGNEEHPAWDWESYLSAHRLAAPRSSDGPSPEGDPDSARRP